MSELMEKEQQVQMAPLETDVQDTAPAGEGKKKFSRKTRRRIIRWVVILVVLIALAVILAKTLGGKNKGESEIITDMVQYGAITSTVEGSGLPKAKKSETITLTTAGTVQEVLVSEGQQVTAGTPLFVVDSEAARTAVEKAREDVEGREKQLSVLQKDIAGLNLTAPHGGKIMLGEDAPRLQPGEAVTKGTVVAELNDDTKMRLEQYYSYAYAGDLYAGQKVQVSIPALMSTVTGTVEAVHMVSRITPEGSKLFAAEIVLENEGVLAKDMAASAVVNVDGEMVYPYEPGKLEYYRTTTLKTTVNGTVLANHLVNYLQVSAGQLLVQIDGEDSESEIFTVQQSLEEARKALETAQKNLDNCNAVAPIDGTVMSLAIQNGQEVEANTAVITIADTSVILVEATVDERNISYVKPGMPVEIDQWGNKFTGIVESVSLNSKAENGVASYPFVIAVDNPDGSMMTGSYISYSMVASENDNCLVIPIQCVKSVPLEDGSAADVVYVKADDRPENAIDVTMPVDGVPEKGFWPVPVEIGLSDQYNVEIKSGLEEGMEVFTTAQTTAMW